MTADPYARLDAVYLLGALDADERLAYEAHLAICRRCRAGLAEISAIPSLLAGLAPENRRPALATEQDGPVSHGRWLVSLTRWTAANPRPCHWISLMQAEPRYSR